MKLQLTLSAVAALCSAAPALAFDTINWNWDADVQTNVDVNAVANIEVDPTGLAQIEGDQIMNGNLTALSTTVDVTNSLDGVIDVSVDDMVAVSTQASGIGNNASLESDVAVLYDLNQTYAGLETSVLDPITGLVISTTTLPALILATATAADITNATVDTAATGVANNISVDVATGSGEDSFVVGNSMQTAMADISTISSNEAISFDDVSGLGTLVDPGVSSVATSVGNNLSVSVSSNILP